MAYLDLGRAVRGVESLLRQRHGIHEFTDDEECVFRVSLGAAASAVALSDGTRLRAGDPVLQLHFWNEHLPLMPDRGPSTGWAAVMQRRMRMSLAAVARYLERERSLDAVNALHGAPPFGSRLGAAQVARTARRFCFDVIDPEVSGEWRERLYVVLDSMLLWGLAYTFNPGRLKTKGVLRHRHQLWISRRRLLSRYGGAAPVRARSRLE